MKTGKYILVALIVPVIILVLWYIATTFGSLPASILPGQQMVGNAFIEMTSNGQLQGDLMISLVRVVKGFLASAITGVFLGSVMGMSSKMQNLLLPTITVIRQIPMVAWIPLIILWSGIGESSKVIIIMIAAVFPILVNTLSGIESTPDGYAEVARLYKLGKWKTFTKVYLPHALPQILVGLKLGLGVSWMAVVASELIAASTGIGYRMNEARSLMKSDKVIVCMIVIGLIGIIMDKLISLLFNQFTPWVNLQKNSK
ncbi:MAG TPA: ABC transporter permease [Lachnospiraceae bacterium]|nr:ABC transporter permease [Lachnospiraceae bacterium]